MSENPELELAWDFVEKTNRNIFLTGKAGTGKTTFLRKITSQSMKRLVVVAPTGVAAINARGVTIHSFFQMGFGPLIPEDPNNPSKESSQFKFNRTKINIIKSLDLLVIDEISMVRADLLDGIDQVLRRYKNKDKVFGGVQVLMIGDLQQLAPVIRPEEWQLLRSYYNNAYFFSSRAFQQANALGIELKHIYRQADEVFINVLNEVRNNNLSEKSAEVLNKRFDPDFEPNDADGYITLTTHNKRADEMNVKAFRKLTTKSKTYKADIKGKFAEFSYPCAERLELKMGAQVMFTKNDSSEDKRYFNGKIGEVVDIKKDLVIVKCQDGKSIDVRTETWTNISYSLDKQTNEISEEIAGSFEQIPLKLAWAITIHKSQGLTFEKAVIDAGASFAHGQTYVALSRCKTLEGIVLKTEIKPASIINDKTVTTFTKNVEENLPDENVLTASEKAYHLSLIEELFNYYSLLYPTNRLVDIGKKNKNSLQGTLLEKATLIKEEGLTKLFPVAEKFNRQLAALSTEVTNPDESTDVQERLQKGINYFLTFTKEHIEKPIKELTYSTENKAVKTDLLEQLKILKEQLAIKLFCLEGLKTKFASADYLKLRVRAVLQKSAMKPEDDYEKTTKHSELLNSLKGFRSEQAKELDVEHYQIFAQRTLFEMCNSLPVTPKQLGLINGMGKVRIQKYGKTILKLINDYCYEKEITPREDPVMPEKPKKGSSQVVSLELFREHGSVLEVAKKRGLATSTIESHLMSFIPTGEIMARELMEEEKFDELKHIMETTQYETLTELKNMIDDKFTFSEMRIVSQVILR